MSPAQCHQENAGKRPSPQVAGPESNDCSAQQGLSIYRLLAIALLLRLCTACLGYSGQGRFPTFGDFEAQRHWMELTTQLPMSQWYFHDPDWWRLDYPPVTAYHSWLMGRLGAMLNPRWFALYTSRGFEEIGLKLFMRGTVLLSELVLFVPAVLCAARIIGSHARRDVRRSLQVLTAAVLLQPALIMVDHGHFQYNSVMLGLFMAAVTSFFADSQLLGCGFFVAALGFKQMSLFYAPAIAAYLAGSCFVPALRASRLLAIAGVTILSFAMLYLPILLGTWHDAVNGIILPLPATDSRIVMSALALVPSEYQPFLSQIAQSIHRIFPFSRGVFEDKVANIWCSIHFSGVYKLATHHSSADLSTVALFATLMLILPPCLVIFLKPRKHLLLLALATCAWAFFLCSFQVHEKNVLLPLLPMTALLAGHHGESAAIRAWVGFANIVGTWSLFHLAIKDDLQAAYFPLLLVWLYVMDLPPFNWKLYQVTHDRNGLSHMARCIHLLAYATIGIWHVVHWVIPPPMDKPDLWIVVNMICSCMAFCACYLWCLSRLLINSGLLDDFCVMVKPFLQQDLVSTIRNKLEDNSWKELVRMAEY